MMSTRATLNGGATLFLTTLIFVILPIWVLLSPEPSSIFVEPRTSRRTEA